jgi:Transposase DDE domain
VKGGTAAVTAVGRARAGGTTHKHGIKAADRFVGNKYLQDELLPIYQAMTSVMLERHGSTLVVLVDWTQLGADHYKLTATVVIAGRSLAIFSIVVTKYCLASREVHEAFLSQLHQIVPRQIRRVVVVTDAGFESTWFELVQALGWDFIGRVRDRTMVRLSDGAWVSNKEVAAAATDTPEDLGWMEFTKSQPMWGRFIRFKEPPKGRCRVGLRRARWSPSTGSECGSKSSSATRRTTAGVGVSRTSSPSRVHRSAWRCWRFWPPWPRSR